MTQQTIPRLEEMPHDARLLRQGEVRKLTGLPQGTLRDLLINKQFPEPIPIGRENGRAVAWISTEVMAWINQRIARRNAASTH